MKAVEVKILHDSCLRCVALESVFDSRKYNVNVTCKDCVAVMSRGLPMHSMCCMRQCVVFSRKMFFSFHVRFLRVKMLVLLRSVAALFNDITHHIYLTQVVSSSLCSRLSVALKALSLIWCTVLTELMRRECDGKKSFFSCVTVVWILWWACRVNSLLVMRSKMKALASVGLSTERHNVQSILLLSVLFFLKKEKKKHYEKIFHTWKLSLSLFPSYYK